jgi:hypothetical protein
MRSSTTKAQNKIANARSTFGNKKKIKGAFGSHNEMGLVTLDIKLLNFT